MLNLLTLNLDLVSLMISEFDSFVRYDIGLQRTLRLSLNELVIRNRFIFENQIL